MTGHINCTSTPITMASFNPKSNYNYLLLAKLSNYPETQKALDGWYPFSSPDTFHDFEVHYLNEQFGFSFDSRAIVSSFGPKNSPIKLSTQVDEKRIGQTLGFPEGIYVTELYILGHKVEREIESVGANKRGRFEVLADTDLEREVLKLIKGIQKAHKGVR